MQPVKETPLFSVLIANYNNGKYLQECLDSVFAQTYTNWEIILVDDASTDGISHKIYEKYKDHPKIKIYYNQENKGCGYTKRRCVEEATGEICGFLDPDDVLVENAIEIMVSKHVKLIQYSLIYSTHYLGNENLTIKKANNKIQQVGPEGYFCGKQKQVSHFAAFKKNKYKQTEGINPTLKRAVDQDLYYKLDETGKFLFINKPLYYYRKHNAGISTANNSLKAKYWHAKVVTDTWKRRIRNNFKPNKDKKEIKKYWEDYYFWKAEEKACKGETLKTFFLTLMTIKYGKSNIFKKLKLIPYAFKQKITK